MKYDVYCQKILEFLIESGGRALRKDIEKALKIPKQSMTDVMKELKSNGRINVLPTFGNKTYWEITLDGKRFYQFGQGPYPDYEIPSVVKEYLSKKPTFKGAFRTIQETFIRRGLLSSRRNVTVFGPPAAGKTLIAEMAMIKEVRKGGKVLYLTPYKALDRQKFKDFQTFRRLGYQVEITDGDNPSSQDKLEKTPIVIATYERALGALSAREEWLKDVTLVCADEITLLGEDRGSTVDSLLTTFMIGDLAYARIITLSSHVGNKFQITDWLQAEAVIENIYQNIEELVVYEDNGYIVLWSKNGEKQRVRSEKSIIEFLVEDNLKRNETTLIFVNSRWEAKTIAKILKPLHELIIKDAEVNEDIQNSLLKLDEVTPLVKSLCTLLKSGVAFHHAGLPTPMRNLVEDLLDRRRIKTVVCTTTLSHGIDYPVDNVIVFLSGLRERWELDAYVCIQLEGRAGRPGKSHAGKVMGRGRAFLITSKDDAVRCMEKYVFGKPENIKPDTLSEDNLSRLVLMLLGLYVDEQPSIDDIVATVKRTLAAFDKSVKMQSLATHIRKIIKSLQKDGLLQCRKSQLSITELGKFLNELNVLPADAKMVIDSLKATSVWEVILARKSMVRKKLRKKISDYGLLHLACCIDIAKKVRSVGSSFPIRLPRKVAHCIITNPSKISRDTFIDSIVKALILHDWINEENLSEITKKYTGYDDYDVYQLGQYASRSLVKIAQIAQRLQMSKLAKRTEELSTRVRFGVKKDLAKSKVIFLHGIGRVRGRCLIQNGFNLNRIATSRPTELKPLLKDAKLCKDIIVQARELLKNENY